MIPLPPCQNLTFSGRISSSTQLTFSKYFLLTRENIPPFLSILINTTHTSLFQKYSSQFQTYLFSSFLLCTCTHVQHTPLFSKNDHTTSSHLVPKAQIANRAALLSLQCTSFINTMSRIHHFCAKGALLFTHLSTFLLLQACYVATYTNTLSQQQRKLCLRFLALKSVMHCL